MPFSGVASATVPKSCHSNVATDQPPDLSTGFLPQGNAMQCICTPIAGSGNDSESDEHDECTAEIENGDNRMSTSEFRKGVFSKNSNDNDRDEDWQGFALDTLGDIHFDLLLFEAVHPQQHPQHTTPTAAGNHGKERQCIHFYI